MRNAILLVAFTPPLFACCCCGGCGNWPTGLTPPQQPTVTTAPSRLDARSQAAETDSLRIDIPAVMVSYVELETGGKTSPSNSKHLMIRLRARNKSATEAAEFPGWGSPDGPLAQAVLTDNLGNRYQQSEFPRTSRVVGRATSTRIAPGSSSDDTLVFGQPAQNAKELYLDLPLPDGEMARFTIPMSMVIIKK